MESKTEIKNGCVTSYNNIEKIIGLRTKYLNKQKCLEWTSKILNREPLMFKPTDIREHHIYSRENYGEQEKIYNIVCFGVLPSGQRCTVVLENIELYFEVRVPDKISPEIFNAQLYKILNKKPYKFMIREAYPFMGYSETPCKWIRMYFKSATDRKDAIQKVRTYTDESNGVKYCDTAVDDLSNVFRVILRNESIGTGDWNKITNYDVRKVYGFRGMQETYDSYNTTYYIPDWDSKIAGKCIVVDIKNFKTQHEVPVDIRRDLTISATWDCEMFSPDRSLPSASNPEHRLFNIGITFQFIHEKKPFLRVALYDFPTAPHEDCNIFVCGKEKNILLGFAKIIGLIQPEIIMGFNDMDFDYKFCIPRALETTGLFTDMVNLISADQRKRDDRSSANYNYKKGRIKIDASTNVDVAYLDVPGILPLDMRVVFRKLMRTTEKTSLNFYLSECKLNSKELMPYNRLFKAYGDMRTLLRKTKFAVSDIWDTDGNIYGNESAILDRLRKINPVLLGIEEERDYKGEIKEETNIYSGIDITNGVAVYNRLKEIQRDIAYYCVIDAERCHDLCLAKNIINDYRQIASMTYTTPKCSAFYADGCRVTNLTIHTCQNFPFNIAASAIIKGGGQDEKYPGAYVFDPIKGLKAPKLSIVERIRKELEIKEKYEKQSICVPSTAPHTAPHTAPTTAPSTAPSTAPHYLKKYFNDGFVWSNTPPEDIELCYRFIRECGVHMTEVEYDHYQRMNDIWKRLPAHFKQFILEDLGLPITGLDFSSLYPSIIRTYNFSPEKCVRDEALKNALEAKWAEEDKNLTDDIKRKFIPVQYEFNGQICRAWFLWHSCLWDKNSSNFRFGVYPYILNNLFNLRLSIKKDLKPQTTKREKLDLEISSIKKRLAEESDSASIQATLEELEKIYDNLLFEIAYLNSKQLAVKLLMNTYYGNAGSPTSPFFMRDVAAGTTSYGVNSIKQAEHWVVEDYKCVVHYGDTDSLYISISESCFKQQAIEYYTNKMSKLDYCTFLVKETFVQIKKVQDYVNEQFIKLTRTPFMSMAYEEVLFFVLFAAKKKYFGIPHEHEINFKPKKIFVRGFEAVKRGVSGLLKKLFNNITWQILSLDNLYTVQELCYKACDEIYEKVNLGQIDFTDFVQSDTYKPNKKNTKVQTFVSRMNMENITIIPNERYQYVIVEKYPYKYDLRGKAEPISVGDKIELVDRAKEFNMRIDIDHYVSGPLITQLARLMSDHPDYYVKPASDSKEDIKKANEASMKRAKKVLDTYCAKYYKNYEKHTTFHKSLYTSITNTISREIRKFDSGFAQLLQYDVEIDENLPTHIESKIDNEAKLICKKYGEQYIKKRIATIMPRLKKSDSSYKLHYNSIMQSLQKIYYSDRNNILDKRKRSHDAQMAKLSRAMDNKLEQIQSIYRQYNHYVVRCSTAVHAIIGTDKYTLSTQDKNYPGSIDQINYNTKEVGDVIKQNVKELISDSNFIKHMEEFGIIRKQILCQKIIYNEILSIVDYLKKQRTIRTGIIPIKVEIHRGRVIQEIPPAIPIDIDAAERAANLLI